MNTAPPLQISKLSKVYPNGLKALDDVSFTVKEGEFFGLLGPNGAGKTTLISAIASLSRPTSGEVRVFGLDTQKDANQTKRLLGIVPQELVFDPFFTVGEVLAYQSGYYGIYDNQAWLTEILTHLDLLGKVNANTRSLSGGMKRRLMVAQALVHKPKIIILDEPTAGVDVELRQSLWKFMVRLNRRGLTILLTTHYLEEAEQFCERIAFLKKGKIIAIDKTQKLLAGDPFIHVEFTCDADAAMTLLAAFSPHVTGHQWHFALNNYRELEELLHIVNTAPLKISGLQIKRQDLEQVFLKLMR